MRTVEWRAANGDTIIFSRAKPYMLDTFYPSTPAGTAEIVRGIRTDGQTTYNVVADALTPSLVGSIQAQGKTYELAQKNLDELRSRLQAALNPKHFGELIYTDYAGAHRLICRPMSGAAIGKRIGNAEKIDIEWVSDEPYWTQAQQKSLSIGVTRKLWRFPWIIAPTVFGSILSDRVIINPTIIEIMPIIIIADTASENITIGNKTTGDQTTITQKIVPGQKLELNMSTPSATLIDVDGTPTDVTHWITLNSAFPWGLAPGLNEIFTAVDTPDISPVITIMWHQPEEGL